MDRRVFILHVPVLAGAFFGSGAQSADNRTLTDKIADFLSLRLTQIVIKDYILDPLRYVVDTLKPSTVTLTALYRAVHVNLIAYGELWGQLDRFLGVTTPVLRASVARDAAKAAGEVNDGLKALRDAVASMKISERLRSFDDPTKTIEEYTQFPGTPSDIERFLVQATPDEISRIVKETQAARVAVAKAHDCFLCYLRVRDAALNRDRGLPKPSIDCADCK